MIIILAKNHALSLALGNHCQIAEHSINQLNQLLPYNREHVGYFSNAGSYRLFEQLPAQLHASYNCEHVGHLATPAPTDNTEHSPALPAWSLVKIASLVRLIQLNSFSFSFFHLANFGGLPLPCKFWRGLPPCKFWSGLSLFLQILARSVATSHYFAFCRVFC